MLKYIFY